MAIGPANYSLAGSMFTVVAAAEVKLRRQKGENGVMAGRRRRLRLGLVRCMAMKDDDAL